MEGLRRTAGSLAAPRRRRARTEGTQARSHAEPQNSRQACSAVGGGATSLPPGDVSGGRAGHRGRIFPGSRGPVAAPGVSCPGVQRLLEKQKRWAGRRRGKNGWRVGVVPRTLPQSSPMVEKGLARGGTSRLEALSPNSLVPSGFHAQGHWFSPLPPPSEALSRVLLFPLHSFRA